MNATPITVDDENEGGALLCSRCGKALTDDPTLPISQMGDNVFLRSDGTDAGIVVCGACAGRMVLMTLMREGAFDSARAG